MPPHASTVPETKITGNPQYESYDGNAASTKQPLNYTNIVSIGLAHAAFVYVFFTFPWIEKFYMAFYIVFVMHFAAFGVTAGAHRYFTHRSYKATLPLKIILLICYASCGHNKLYDWVRDHRTHHKYVETDADPHNSNRGFFFSHVGWLLMKKHPEVIVKGKGIDMSDIESDPLLIWYDRHYIIMKTIFCFIIPTVIPHYLFGEDWYTCIVTQCIIRYILLLNCTWSVNSVAHFYGTKPYSQIGNATDNVVVSLITTGEGWHNYHHAFPWDYKTSEYGRISVTTTGLNFFGKLGWAYDFKTASDDLIRKMVQNSGDGVHEMYPYSESSDNKES